MRPIAIAVTRTFWQRNQWWILLALAGMTALTIALSGRLYDELNAVTILRFHYNYCLPLFAFIVWLPLACHFGSNRRFGFADRYYTLPVATWILVACHMIPAMVTAALLYAVVAGCGYLVFGTPWPLWGPMMFAATAVACTHAIAWWLIGTHLLRLAASAAAAVALAWWFMSRYGAGLFPLTGPTRMWSTITTAEVLTMAGATAIAYFIAVTAVRRDRCSDHEAWPKWLAWGKELTGADILPAGRGRFRSPVAAQLWWEWRERASIAPMAAAIAAAGILVCYEFGVIDATKSLTHIAALALILPITAAFFIGVATGSLGRHARIGCFMATRPLSNAMLSAVACKAGAVSILATWLVLVPGVLLLAARMALGGHGAAVIAACEEGVTRLHEAGLWQVTGVLLVGWTALGLGASLGLTGRFWLFGLFGVLWYAGMIIFGIAGYLGATDRIPARLVELFWAALPWAIGIVFLSTTVWAFVAARRRALVSRRILVLAPAAWLLLCYIWGVTQFSTESASASRVAAFLGLLALPLAPLATAPLALYWNRHR